MRILKTKQAKGCRHRLLQCLECGSIFILGEEHKFNDKELLKLATKVRKILEKEAEK